MSLNPKKDSSLSLASTPGLHQRLRFFDKLMSHSKDIELKLPSYFLNWSTPAPSGQDSKTIIFSIWNCMVGSTVLSIPWGMEQAGLISGLMAVIFFGVLACYTCSLIMKHSEGSEITDFSEVMYKLWGINGQRVTIVMSCILLLGGCMAYNVLLNSSFYMVINGLSIWISGSSAICSNCSSIFSATFTPVLLLPVLVLLLNFKDKSKYFMLTKVGLGCLVIIILSIIAIGIRALAINTFTTEGDDTISDDDKECDDDWNCVDSSVEVHINLFNPKVLQLAGVLSLSYFIHNAIVNITKTSINPQHNMRDLSLGYLAAGISYASIALMGYLGFRANGFAYAPLKQNVLDMFSPSNPVGFVLRTCLMIQMFIGYPMLMYFIRAQLFGYLYGTDTPSRKKLLIFSIVLPGITTLVAMFYPKVGSISAIVGSACGLYFVYAVPVLVHLKMKYQITEDSQEYELSEDIQVLTNDETQISHKPIVSKIPINLYVVLHMFIPILGAIVLVFQFIPL